MDYRHLTLLRNLTRAGRRVYEYGDRGRFRGRAARPASAGGHVDAVRRRLVGSSALLLVAAPSIVPLPTRAAASVIEVWTGPSCSCCHDWIEHLQANGFEVITHDGGNYEARAALGMPIRYGSCHSAEVDGFAIEGHVPASDIHHLLEERPDAIGLSVPAMPRGAPGMDGPVYRGIRDPYDVLLVQHDGSVEVYRSYR